MNENQKKTIKYDDFTLEEIPLETLKKRNEEMSAVIKAGKQGNAKHNGEFILKFTNADDLAEVEGKDKLLFEVEMPFFDDKGVEGSRLIGYREGTVDPDRGKVNGKKTRIKFMGNPVSTGLTDTFRTCIPTYLS